MLDLTFSFLYLAGFLFLFILEMIGVKSKRPGDTITENWRYLDSHLHGPLQWGLRVLTSGVTVWLLFHLGGKWG